MKEIVEKEQKGGEEEVKTEDESEQGEILLAKQKVQMYDDLDSQVSRRTEGLVEERVLMDNKMVLTEEYSLRENKEIINTNHSNKIIETNGKNQQTQNKSLLQQSSQMQQQSLQNELLEEEKTNDSWHYQIQQCQDMSQEEQIKLDFEKNELSPQRNKKEEEPSSILLQEQKDNVRSQQEQENKCEINKNQKQNENMSKYNLQETEDGLILKNNQNGIKAIGCEIEKDEKEKKLLVTPQKKKQQQNKSKNQNQDSGHTQENEEEEEIEIGDDFANLKEQSEKVKKHKRFPNVKNDAGTEQVKQYSEKKQRDYSTDIKNMLSSGKNSAAVNPDEKSHEFSNSHNKRSFANQDLSNYLSNTDCNIHPFSITAQHENCNVLHQSGSVQKNFNNSTTTQGYDSERITAHEQATGEKILQASKRLSISQTEEIIDNPLSISELNQSTQRRSNNSSQTLLSKQSLFSSFFLPMIQVSVLILNCFLYGLVIPQWSNSLGSQAHTIFLSFMCIEGVYRACSSSSFLKDYQLIYQCILIISNIFFSDYRSPPVYGILLFGKLLISLWNLGSINQRIKGFSASLRYSFGQNLEVLGFICLILTLSSVSLSILSKEGQGNQNKSELLEDVFAFFYQFVLKVPSQQNIQQSLQSQQLSILMYIASFSILFLLKTVGTSLLSVVQKVSQEQVCEQLSSCYDCGIFAVFRNSQSIKAFYRNKVLYKIVQLLLIVLYTSIKFYQDFNQSWLQIPEMRILSAYLRFGTLCFSLYEVSINAALSSAQSISKNMIFLYAFMEPNRFEVLLLIPFYGLLSSISFFKVITTHLEALFLDTSLIISISYIIQFSYTACDSSVAIPAYIPMIIQFAFSEPLLKGMMLRFSEIFEIEEDEETIINSLHTQPFAQLDQKQANQQDTRNQITDQIHKDGSIQIPIKPIKPLIYTTKNKFIKRSLFIFSSQNQLRRYAYSIVNSSLFQQLEGLFFFFTAMKEIIYFASSSLAYDSFPFIEQWENILEPTIAIIIAILKIICYGFFIGRQSFLLRQISNSVLFLLMISIHVLQPVIFPNTYIGFTRVLFLACVLPLGSKKLNDLISSISRSKKIILQILFISAGCFLIAKLRNNPPDILIYMFYIFAVTLLAPAILVELSKQQLLNQNKNYVWESIKDKIFHHELSLQPLKKSNSFGSRSRFLQNFIIQSPNHTKIQTVLSCVVYISLFIILYLLPSVLDYTTSSKFCSKIILVYSVLLITYCILLILANGFYLSISSSLQNKVLIILSASLIVTIIVECVLGSITSKNSGQIQFALQLPLLFRTKLMFPIVKFSSSIFRQVLVTTIYSIITILALAYFIEDTKLSAFNYLIAIFNLNPQSLTDSSLQSVLILVSLLILNGIVNSTLILDIIRKFDLNEYALAKNKYKSLVKHFETIWNQYKTSNNPTMMPASNLIYFLVCFDKSVQDEEDEDNKSLNQNKPQKPKKIDYLKRIMHMNINLQEGNQIHFKFLLLRLVADKMNQDIAQNASGDSVCSFYSIPQQSIVMSNFTIEDIELSQRNQISKTEQTYNPIKDFLYRKLMFATWKSFAKTSIQKELLTPAQTNQEEEDSIFFDSENINNNTDDAHEPQINFKIE